ncbi:hypothetical protein EHS25_000185 [Saitozyma podzolica]|uniref:Peptidase S9 prolyl oligopeptidase catalytic domain-containing protein n=1 Tax=Saitozyma podzolica TaxID=1890683 RepID=A0A427YVM1_9TREE|nr:hypothetical protein EHS25_000185 [Saitozyma podzolica]
MDYPSLTLGHPDKSLTTIHIVDLKLNIYGLEEIKGSGLPVAAVIATHGRMNKKEQMGYFAQGLLGEIEQMSKGKEKKRDVIVVTLDQRNHGERTHDRTANLAYDQNERHLYDMAATVVGGCHDVSLIIDFLAAYLFPLGDRVIDEFIATGVSLGGNVTWRLLLSEPRINVAIPIIGLPFTSFAPYLRARAHKMGLAWTPPLYPPSLRPLLEAPAPPNAYRGKKILSIHGADDTLVPIKEGQKDLDKIVKEAEQGDVKVWVVEGKGHVVTGEMVTRTAEWVWRWALQA